jgi:prolyl-tRNA synthetase
LLDKGIDVLLDDRDIRGGIKFKDADLLGIPVRITVGSKSVKESNIEIKLRRESHPTSARLGETGSQKVPIKEAVNKTIELVDLLKKQLNS